MIINTIIEQVSDPRVPLAVGSLIQEISFPQIIGVVCCQRDGEDIFADHKTLPIPVFNVVKELESKSKQKDTDFVNGFRELGLTLDLELNNLRVVRDNGFDLKALLEKKRKPSAKQRAAKRRKLAEEPEDQQVSTIFFCNRT